MLRWMFGKWWQTARTMRRSGPITGSLVLAAGLMISSSAAQTTARPDTPEESALTVTLPDPTLDQSVELPQTDLGTDTGDLGETGTGTTEEDPLALDPPIEPLDSIPSTDPLDSTPIEPVDSTPIEPVDPAPPIDPVATSTDPLDAASTTEVPTTTDPPSSTTTETQTPTTTTEFPRIPLELSIEVTIDIQGRPVPCATCPPLPTSSTPRQSDLCRSTSPQLTTQRPTTSPSTTTTTPPRTSTTTTRSTTKQSIESGRTTTPTTSRTVTCHPTPTTTSTTSPSRTPTVTTSPTRTLQSTPQSTQPTTPRR